MARDTDAEVRLQSQRTSVSPESVNLNPRKQRSSLGSLEGKADMDNKFFSNRDLEALDSGRVCGWM